MELEYIDENLNRILQNPDSVLYLRPDDIGNKRALFAMVKEEEGVYKKLQITKEQSKMSFPWEPIYWFYRGPGYLLLKNFMSFHNIFALNTANLDGFKVEALDESRFFDIVIFAVFNDGSATFVKRQRKKRFEKEGGIQTYINLLKQYKDYEPKHESFKFIESYDNGTNTFIIPELQEKVIEQPNVKKLSKNNNI